MLRIKAEPELQHVLQHMRMAIDALADGYPEAAKMEMLSIEGLVQYETMAEMESFSEAQATQDRSQNKEKGVHPPQEPKTEEVDGSAAPG